MSDCITCKKNNKGNNWRDCRLKCHYKYEQQKKDEIYKLKEENEKLKKILQELEDLSLKTYDVADFQMFFDNLRGIEK